MATIQGAVATTEFVDAQYSTSGGVMLQVCGSMNKKVRVHPRWPCSRRLLSPYSC